MLETQTNDFTYKIIVRRTKQETKQKNNKIKQTQTKNKEEFENGSTNNKRKS